MSSPVYWATPVHLALSDVVKFRRYRLQMIPLRSSQLKHVKPYVIVGLWRIHFDTFNNVNMEPILDQVYFRKVRWLINLLLRITQVFVTIFSLISHEVWMRESSPRLLISGKHFFVRFDPFESKENGFNYLLCDGMAFCQSGIKISVLLKENTPPLHPFIWSQDYYCILHPNVASPVAFPHPPCDLTCVLALGYQERWVHWWWVGTALRSFSDY